VGQRLGLELETLCAYFLIRHLLPPAVRSIYLANAFITIPSSQLTATLSAECSLCTSPSSILLPGHSFTVCDIMQMMHGVSVTLKYDEPVVENVAQTTVLHMFCCMANH